jgi:Ca2+-dependent lipid-binding protein
MFSGFNPRWNQELSFSLKVPELAMVHFIVKDSSTTGRDAMLGMYALPFTSIQEGEAASWARLMVTVAISVSYT